MLDFDVFLDLMGVVIHNDRSSGSRNAMYPNGFEDPQDTNTLRKMYYDKTLPPMYYVTTAQEVKFCPLARAAMCNLSRIAKRIFIVTNNEAIELGLVTMEEYRAHVVSYIEHELARDLVEIKEWAICPHLPSTGCDCRKPSPKMIKDLAVKHKVDLSKSWMIGDNKSDILAGRAAGCQTIHVRYPGRPKIEATYTADCLFEAVSILANN